MSMLNLSKFRFFFYTLKNDYKLDIKIFCKIMKVFAATFV